MEKEKVQKPIEKSKKRWTQKQWEKWSEDLYKKRQKDRREKMTGVTISKSEMQAYEDCRASGVTNMFNVKRVEQLTGLSKEKLFYIMDGKNYSNLMRLHNIKRR